VGRVDLHFPDTVAIAILEFTMTGISTSIRRVAGGKRSEGPGSVLQYVVNEGIALFQRQDYEFPSHPPKKGYDWAG